MNIADKIKETFFNTSDDPTAIRRKQEQKEEEQRKAAEKRCMELNHRKNEVRIMLEESESGLKRVMAREVENARRAMELGIDYSLNKNQFSDAMRGIECIQRARWYMDSITSEQGLHGALSLLNHALKTMNRLDGDTKMVNSVDLQNRVNHLYELENLTEESAVLPPTQDYKYKFENGLFENMLNGMSYEKASQLSHQDLTVGGTQAGAAPNFSDIFADKAEEEKAAALRRTILESRKDEI